MSGHRTSRWSDGRGARLQNVFRKIFNKPVDELASAQLSLKPVGLHQVLLLAQF